MKETPTQRYVDTILEAAGLLKKGRLNPKGLEDIRKMDDKQTRSLADSLWEQVYDHYKHNLSLISESIAGKDKKSPQQKGIYFGGTSPIYAGRKPLTIFLRKAALYYDKLILQEPLGDTLNVRAIYKPKGLRENLYLHMSEWLLLKSWVDVGLVESILGVMAWEGFEPAIWRLADEDSKNEGWKLQALRSEDIGLEGKDLINYAESFIQATASEEVIRKMGGLREFALKTIVQGNSINVGGSVFLAGFMGEGCVPITDLRQYWRLLGFWLGCRMDLVVRSGLLDRDYAERWRAGAALLNLEAPKLGFLEGLTPSQIGELRTSDEYRFQGFRRKWAEVCSQLKKMPWEPDFQKDANQLWTEEIVPEVVRIRKDLATVKTKIAAQGLISSLGIITTLVPGLTWVGLVAAILPLLVPRASIPETLKRLEEIKTDNRNDTYFLLAAEEKAIDYSRI